MTRSEIKSLFDDSVFLLHNLIYSGLAYLNPKIKKELKRNLELKNKHLGEKCVILGNGPSLKNFDKKLAVGKTTFAVNYFYKNDFMNDIYPDYYVLIDELFYNEKFNAFQAAAAKFKNSIFLFKTKCFKYDTFKEILASKVKFYVTYNQSAQVGTDVDYDLTKNITASVNVVNHCIQTALYMGFKEIYLVGCDFNSFSSTKPLYAYDNGTEPKELNLGDELKFYSVVCYHHYALAKKAKELNIKIINATPNSLLDAYPIGSIE